MQHIPVKLQRPAPVVGELVEVHHAPQREADLQIHEPDVSGGNGLHFRMPVARPFLVQLEIVRLPIEDERWVDPQKGGYAANASQQRPHDAGQHHHRFSEAARLGDLHELSNFRKLFLSEQLLDGFLVRPLVELPLDFLKRHGRPANHEISRVHGWLPS